MKKKRILVLTSTFPRWKNDHTPPFIFELEKRLVKDFEIHILAPHYQGAKKEEMMEGLHIHRFQYFWPVKLQKLCYEGGILPNLKKNKLLYIQALSLILFELIAAIKIVKKEKINLIHAHWIIPQGIVALFIKKIFKVPYIATAHGSDAYGLENGFLRRIKEIMLKEAKSITVVSDEIKNKLKTDFKNLEINTISMGVDSNQFNPNKYESKIKNKYHISGPFLLFVGRLAEVKGLEFLIKSMPKIIKRISGVKLIVIGHGPLLKNLKKLVFELNLDKKVIFIGAISYKSLPRFFSAADIFILPSISKKGEYQEGFGLTMIEAMFSGCMCITTKSWVKSMKRYKFIQVVKEKNPNQIADKVIYFLNNKVRLKKLAIKYIKDFIPLYDWKYVFKKYKKLYLSEL